MISAEGLEVKNSKGEVVKLPSGIYFGLVDVNTFTMTFDNEQHTMELDVAWRGYNLPCCLAVRGYEMGYEFFRNEYPTVIIDRSNALAKELKELLKKY